MKPIHTERRRNIIVASSLGVLTLALSLALYVGGIGMGFPTRIRALAETILYNTYNPWNVTLTSYSLNAVSAIIWDYRGIDTIFETTVLLASITAVTVILKEKGPSNSGSSITLISKFTTRLVLLITLLISISTAVNGHLTPGGGFQAGAMITTGIILSLAVFFSSFSRYSYFSRKENLLLLRYLVLTAISVVALLPVLVDAKAYVMQNQSKPTAPFSMPTWFIDTPLAGSILVFNVLEAIAVAFALSYTIIILLESCTNN
ncbi:MAG: Na(+)/H(+) antiporter subunit B [Desulfurococcaceae archaeon]